MMKNADQKRSAKVVGGLFFTFMSTVSALIYFTGDNLGSFDLALITLAPFALAAGSYFVVLNHDPEHSD